MPEDALLRTLPLADRLRIAAVDLALTGAPRALVEAVWLAADALERSSCPEADQPLASYEEDVIVA
jgi:hypothetical protein